MKLEVVKEMKLSPFREANSSATTEEFRNILRNPKIHYRAPLVPVLYQKNPVHTTKFCLPKIRFNFIL
jgi:hypothetical protein